MKTLDATVIYISVGILGLAFIWRLIKLIRVVQFNLKTTAQIRRELSVLEKEANEIGQDPSIDRLAKEVAINKLGEKYQLLFDRLQELERQEALRSTKRVTK